MHKKVFVIHSMTLVNINTVQAVKIQKWDFKR